MPRLKLTAKEIDKLPTPESGYVEYKDLEEGHLFLRISQTGRKSWHYRACWAGRQRREALGAYPKISIAAARYAAQEIDLEWQRGPAAARMRQQQRKTGIVTLQDLWDVYMAAVEKRLREKTLNEKHSLWQLYISDLKRSLLDALNQRDVQSLHDRIARQGKLVTANRVLKVLRACLRWGLDRGYLNHDPTQGVKKLPEYTRERFLQPAEKDRFLTELGKAPVDLRHYVILSIATGARQRNVLSMQWSHLDLERRTWSIPRPESKNGEPLVIPLVQAAVDVLQERREKIKGDYVFPSRKKCKRPYVQSFKKSWNAVCGEAGCPDLHMHDLRRTLGSWMAMGNVSGAIIGRALGHQDPASTAIYARLMTDPVAVAMDEASKQILAPPPRKKETETENTAD